MAAAERWKKGQSGNPGGKPKADYKIRDLAKAKTQIALDTLEEICKSGESESARVAAAIALLDRGYGKPTQPISGDEDAPLLKAIEFHIVDHRPKAEG